MMDERQAQALATAIKLKSRAWIDDDMYGAFLHTEIFGSLPQDVSVIPSKEGDGFAVSARWKYIGEVFNSVDEWEAFAAKIEERMGLAALADKGEAESPYYNEMW
jgi:extradiol dioxygenase family protein